MKNNYSRVLISLVAFCLVFSCKQPEQKNVEDKQKLEVKSITLDGKAIKDDSVVEVYKPKAKLVVEFVKEYEGVTLFVNSEMINVNAKTITHTIDGIDKEGIDVKVDIKQKDRLVKSYNFKVKLFDLEKDIVSFIFEGENINASSALNRNKKEVKIEEIAKDGSTNVGQTTFFKLAVSLKCRSGKAHKFSVENKTTNETQESEVINEGLIKVFIPLKNGDNNLILSVSEEGVDPISYKLIASYKEPEYKPITFIQFEKETYIGNEGLAKLLTGTEKMYSYGKVELPCKIQMSETWYHDSDWTLSIDGKNIEKTAFIKENISPIVYNYSGVCSLKEGEEKEIVVVFENTRRTYKKDYKIKVKHENILSFTVAYFFDEKTKKGEEKKFDKYKKDGDVYKLDPRVPFKDWTKKISCVIETDIKELDVKYAFSKTLVATTDITEWKQSQKETLSYIPDYSTTEKKITGYVAKAELEYGESYLYAKLEKNGLKTCYITPIFRVKVDENDTKEEEHKLIYKDSDGNALEEKEAILATKGLILVKPKSPRATVKLLTPEAKPFTLNDDEYFECEVSLISKEVECSYEITAENNVDKKTYNVKFTKPEIIGRVRYGYKEKATSADLKMSIPYDSSYTIEISKEKVVSNKIYFNIEAYKELSLNCNSLVFKKKYDLAGRTFHIFEADVASLVNNTDEKKEFSIDLSLKEKSLGSITLNVFLTNEVLDSVKFFPDHYNKNKFFEFAKFSSNVYKVKGKFGNDTKMLIVYLYAVAGESGADTNRKVKIFDGANEKNIIYRVKDGKLECSYTGLSINEGEEKTFKVEYYKDKNDSSPTKTYSLVITSM